MKDIKGYEGLYAVTSCGKVWSYNRNRFLKEDINKDGYHRVTLFKNNKGKHFSVHRLVAEAYIENPLNLPDVNHKDENKDNNSILNLEWCTEAYNNSYGSRPIKARLGNIKCKVKCIETGEIFECCEDARRKYGTHVSSVIHGRRKTCSGYHFEEVV